MNYTEFLPKLISKRSVKTYMEIGVSSGYLMHHVACETAIGIDPAFDLKFDVSTGKKFVHLYSLTSDMFFADPAYHSAMRGQIDFAFLDGMHTFEFLLRDFYNAERLCNERSLIAIHDSLPPTEEMTERNFGLAAERGHKTAFPYHWTGDVWKIILILKKHRPDLHLIFTDAPPTGIVFATNLDPESNLLKQNYMNIINEFRSLPSNSASLNDLYAGINITSTDVILNSLDQSLYFVT